MEVLRLPASASTRSLPKLGAPEPKPPALAAAAPPSLPLPELKRSLAHGDVTEALRLIEQADGPEREQACRVIGQALASAWTAEQVLDGLTPRDQLEVCRAWAADQRFLVETFDRLAVLANDPTIRVEFEDVIRELAAEQGLRGWMRKSGLADLADPGRPVG